jgi:hypothetical protein
MSHLSPDAQRLIARSKQLDDPSHAERERMRALLTASWPEAAPPPTDSIPAPSSRSWGAKTVWGVVSVAALFAAGAWQRAHVAPLRAATVVAAHPQSAAGSNNASDQAAPNYASGQAHTNDASDQAAERALQNPTDRTASAEHVDALARGRSGSLSADSDGRTSAPPPKHARAVTSRRASPPRVADPNPPAEPRGSVAQDPAHRPIVAASGALRAASSVNEKPRARAVSYVASAEPAADEPAKTRAPTPAPEAIDDELLLLGAAQEALRSGHPSRALQLVQQHGFRFPTGALVQERLTVHVLSLCALQRTNAAREIYAELQRRAAQSPVLARVRTDCGF